MYQQLHSERSCRPCLYLFVLFRLNPFNYELWRFSVRCIFIVECGYKKNSVLYPQPLVLSVLSRRK